MATASESKGLKVAEIWKQSATSLSTCVLAMAGFWLVEAREFPRRSEVSEMIHKESPYVRDQGLILKQLSQNELTMKELQHSVNDLQLELANFRRGQ